MNVSAPNKRKLPWRKIISIGIVLLVVGYKYAQPTLEKWTGMDLPAVNGNRGNHHNPTARGDASTNSPDYSVNFPEKSGQSSVSGGFQLKEVGRNRFESPPAHGVFIGNGDRDTVLKLIDDAWELAEEKSSKAKYEKSRGNDAWTVNMGRKVGFDGGKKGQRNGGKSLNSIKLILANGNQVITAYPVR